MNDSNGSSAVTPVPEVVQPARRRLLKAAGVAVAGGATLSAPFIRNAAAAETAEPGLELAALKALGERNYVEFKLAKTKGPQKVGDISILLKKADPKTNRYTITVIADDKTVEKRDKTINEPVQFMLAKASQPYELVVNDVKKDLISGYVASPKVQQTRNQN